MTIRKININGNEYEFINHSRSTRNGFAHDTTLFIDGVMHGKASCHYLNRTWECYRFQTVMQRCISNIINTNEEDYIAVYKADNGIKRLTAEKRGQIIKEFYEQENIKELLEVYELLKHSN
jgi:hypothetical protein